MLKPEVHDLQILLDFLNVSTPEKWVRYAANQIPLLLIDHAHCERKAAAMALMFLSKYPEKKDIIDIMSPLAREELLHFEKVMSLMDARAILFTPLKPSGYAQWLHQSIDKSSTKSQLRDQLIIGAIIEARSCERFYALAPAIEDIELAKFYKTLAKAEARHFENYLHLAHRYGENTDARIRELLAIENTLVTKPDSVFRFHSGVPMDATDTD